MKSLKGSQTEKNIIAAFIGESQARNKYTFWASQAKKEGFMQIAAIFTETADQEKEHAKRLFSFLEGGEVELTVSAGAGTITSTLENLKLAAEGENYEWQEMYPSFAKVAREEGFTEAAVVMENIAIAEKHHAKRYEAFIKHLEDNDMWVQEGPTTWRCMNCGFIYVGKEAPKKCPACAHPQGYFERLVENW
ncbi:rubrerythrin family protein [Treponema phagedenis]|uniref:Rubrerythrin n=1 Tax=Treponema phagedenis TaxID=162 RepID=A0A0B7GXI4_TREPH|nr:rubrerythrin family protein [Treponema phagedenis]EFW36911.1 rubrerythrin [Treponema phagedenis F0421]NVP23017.1 rubrerythrin family protein [Treponema phagedenis]QEJ95136.1 rubrerythrin family protein [Treponema phagedenis]QEJ98193.1 rubrerythrin family protein [Treponema phagedenis]QEK01060.1 rubrerythrin family protein [Treponema phagedenis]